MRLRSLASLRPWLYPYNIEIIYIPISIIYYLVSYYGTVFLCINLLLTFTVIQPAAAKVINKQINQSKSNVTSCFTLRCILCQILYAGLIIYSKLNITVCTPALKLKSLVIVNSRVIPFSYNLYFIFWCVILE